MYIGLHVKYQLFVSGFNEKFSRQVYEKFENIKFY
jgi:hypothetical protein